MIVSIVIVRRRCARRAQSSKKKKKLSSTVRGNGDIVVSLNRLKKRPGRSRLKTRINNGHLDRDIRLIIISIYNIDNKQSNK